MPAMSEKAMSLGERLQHLRKMGLHKGPAMLRVPVPSSARKSIETEVDGRWVETPYGSCFVAETSYALDERRGGLPLGECLALPSSAVAACGREPALTQLDLRRAAFIDTETSGLAGGTGTFVFLMGIGTFDDEGFTVRQYFMRTPAEEKALLHSAAGTLDRCSGLVSYNGRAFDLPLLNTRLVLNRQLPRLQSAPHLDLLFPVRRVWRARIGSCTLGNVEREALAITREETDVPGWLIPSLYRQYLRSGEAGELPRVFYHNLIDILTLVTLATRLCRLFVCQDGLAPALAEVPAVDQVSLGRVYEDLGWSDAGEEAYWRALDSSLPPDARETALRHLALLLKRQERREEAARLWRMWAAEASLDQLSPFVELAKHHEWHAPDLPLAEEWTQQALQRAQAWPPSSRRSLVLADLEHRLNRLQRKLAEP
jgi:uncharacterized protein YprB with RNaseH-like and TPR domain